MSYRSSARK